MGIYGLVKAGLLTLHGAKGRFIGGKVYKRIFGGRCLFSMQSQFKEYLLHTCEVHVGSSIYVSCTQRIHWTCVKFLLDNITGLVMC